VKEYKTITLSKLQSLGKKEYLPTKQEGTFAQRIEAGLNTLAADGWCWIGSMPGKQGVSIYGAYDTVDIYIFEKEKEIGQ